MADGFRNCSSIEWEHCGPPNKHQHLFFFLAVVRLQSIFSQSGPILIQIDTEKLIFLLKRPETHHYSKYCFSDVCCYSSCVSLLMPSHQAQWISFNQGKKKRKKCSDNGERKPIRFWWVFVCLGFSIKSSCFCKWSLLIWTSDKVSG